MDEQICYWSRRTEYLWRFSFIPVMVILCNFWPLFGSNKGDMRQRNSLSKSPLVLWCLKGFFQFFQQVASPRYLSYVDLLSHQHFVVIRFTCKLLFHAGRVRQQPTCDLNNPQSFALTTSWVLNSSQLVPHHSRRNEAAFQMTSERSSRTSTKSSQVAGWEIYSTRLFMKHCWPSLWSQPFKQPLLLSC